MSDAEVHRLFQSETSRMFIVTVRVGDERSGCLVGFTTQCSIDPPRFLVCLSDKNHTFRVAARADVLVVHLVPDTADALAELFGSHTGDEEDKFARCAWHDGPAGVPVLDECENWFAGRILDRVRLGDHTGYLLDPFEAHADPAEGAFTFHRAKRLEPGHEA